MTRKAVAVGRFHQEKASEAKKKRPRRAKASHLERRGRGQVRREKPSFRARARGRVKGQA